MFCFYTPWYQRFFDVSRVYRNGTLAWIGLNTLSWTQRGDDTSHEKTFKMHVKSLLINIKRSFSGFYRRRNLKISWKLILGKDLAIRDRFQRLINLIAF